MDQLELGNAVAKWLGNQGYNSDNCRCGDFIVWYLENYPEGDKSVADAFWAGNWRKETQ